jgi:hypothetical protein
MAEWLPFRAVEGKAADSPWLPPANFSHCQGNIGLVIGNPEVAAFAVMVDARCIIFQPLCYAHFAPTG